MEHEATRSGVEQEHVATRDLLSEQMLRYFIERELAASGGSAKEMTAAACLPEEFDGRLDLTISIVYETIEAHSLAGCNVAAAEMSLDRGHSELADGDYLRACDWYAKAYGAAGQDCP
jgi:hypothetical protein